MAYRITYGQDPARSQPVKAPMLRAQLFTAAALFLAVLLIKLLLPDSRQTLLTYFVPNDQSAVEVAAQLLCRGEGLRDSLIAYCRLILESAGYGA